MRNVQTKPPVTIDEALLLFRKRSSAKAGMLDYTVIENIRCKQLYGGTAKMELGSMLFYESMRLFFGPFASLHFRLNSEGTENIPEAGGALLVANHRCYLDPIVLACTVPRYINFGAGSHLYQFPGTGKLFKLTGFFPVNIYGGAEGDHSQDMASDLLSRGELVGLFPEGIESFMNINHVSKIATFKTGFVKIALESKVPVVPAAIIAVEERHFPTVPGALVAPFVKHPRARDGLTLITYRGVTCRIGRPLDLSPYYEETLSKNLIDHIAGKIKRIVVKLYDGDELDRFMTGETPFDFATDNA